MQPYEPKTFTFPTIDGISEKTLETHLGLYAGYVTNLNVQYEKMKDLGDSPDPAVASALLRRIQFELAGVQNHERYFEVLVDGPTPCTEGSALSSRITDQYGSMDAFVTHIQQVGGMMRGIGWIMVIYDAERSALHTIWITDHELGNVNLPTVLAIDMWEHSYLLDYLPKDKGKYLDAYLKAINWKIVADRFATLI